MGRRLHPLVAAMLVASVVVVSPIAVEAGTVPDTSTLTTIDAGAYIIDMGVLPQTINNGLKPYGLVYQLMLVHQVPVMWVISNAKAKDGIDFSYNGTDYKGGAFIIGAEYAAAAAPVISSWVAANPGLTVVGPTTTPLQAPVFDTLTNWPNAILDARNGSIAQAYYVNAGIAQTTSTPLGTRTAYEFKDPALLDACDDLYVMPHADPTWATHKNLVAFNEQGGFIWAACHAVSVLENVRDPLDPNPDPEMNFLSTSGLVPFGSHDGGTPPYTYATTLGSDPIMQFMGTIDAATENGSEQIYLPAKSSAWRPSATVLVWDPDHPDLTSQGGASPGEAAKLVYGRGFGDDTNGYVMYEGGHSHNKGTAGDVAAQRAFFNLHLMSGIERGVDTSVSVPEPVVANATVTVSGTITGGTPNYNYQWTSSCGGSFTTPTGTTSSTSVTTQFTAPGTGGDCIIRLVVNDTCGRTSFAAGATEIVEVADLAITKSDGVATAESGTNLTYTVTVTNSGPGIATGVVVDDLFPPELSFSTAVPSQGTCAYNGTTVTCSLGTVAVGGSATVAVTGTIDADAVGAVTNSATVTAPQLDPDPGDNTATDTTLVGPNGLGIEKSANPSFIDEASLPATVVFTMLVTNEGPNPLSNVAVTDDTCSPVVPTVSGGFNVGDTDSDGLLDPGEVWEYTCSASLSVDTDNTATVTGDDLVLGLLGLSATDTAHVEAIAPNFTITKSPDGAQHSDEADVVFEIVVTNSGDVDLVDLAITDGSAPGCDRFIGYLQVGASISYWCSISPAPAAGASGTNTISGTALDPGGSPLTRTDTAPWTVVDRNLGITKTPIDCATGTPLTDPAYYPGDTVCYEIVVTNTGSTPQTNVTLTDNLPAGLSLVDTVVVAPDVVISDDFNTDVTDKRFYTSGLLEFGEALNADGNDVRVQDLTGGGCSQNTENCGVEITQSSNGVYWATDLSGAASAAVAFDWRITDVDNTIAGSWSVSCWSGAAWVSLQAFTIPAEPFTVPGPTQVVGTTYTLPVACQIAAGRIGFISGAGNDGDHDIVIDNLVITSLDGGGATVGTLEDNFEFWENALWNYGWAEFGDNGDKDAQEVRSRTPGDFGDCDTPGDCAVGMDNSNQGIYFPASYSTRGQCTIAFDWRVFATDNDAVTETFSVGGINSGGTWVEVANIPFTAATATFTRFSVTFDDVMFPALFIVGGGLGVKTGASNDGADDLLVDNMVISCLDTFTTTANPNVVTAADAITLPPGGTITATVTATVDAPADPATGAFPRELANLAQTTSDEQPEPSEAVATIERVVPLLTLQKDVDPLAIAAGETVTYTFTVENTGNDPLENVTISDPGVSGCAPTLISGDDGDGILQLTEVWVYECTATPPATSPTFVNTAVVSGDPVTAGTGEGAPVSDTDDATIEVIVSGIEVVKTVDRSIIRPNETVVYTYAVTIAGGTIEALTGVFVTDDVCSPLSGPNAGDDGDGTLEVGETWLYSCTTALTVTTTNVATASGTDRGGVDVTDSDTETVTVIEPALTLTKTASPTVVTLGGTVTYTIVVENTGNDTFTSVAVSDDMCSPLSTPIESGTVNGILDVGETWTYTCSTSPLNNDTTNIAEVTAVDSLGKTWTAADDAYVNVLTPALTVAKINDGSLIFPDGLVTYTIIVYNSGDFDFSVVNISDDTCSPLTGPTGDDGDLVLEAGESWFYECMTTLTATTLNTVTVNADGPGGPASGSGSSEVRVRDMRLAITKTPSVTVVDPGTVVTYDFGVTNVSVCAAGDIICELDHEMSNVTVTDDHCPTVDPVDADFDGYNDGDTGADGVMAIGETWLFTCSAAVNTPTTNTAFAVATDVLGESVPLIPPTVTAFVDVTTAPVLDVVKSGPGSDRVGQTVTFTFNVTNVTDCPAHPDPAWCTENSWVENVTVTDDVAGVAAPIESGGFNVGDTDSDGRLDVGETWQFTVDYVLTDADLVATPLVNTGTASGADRDGDTVQDQGSHSTDVLPRESDLSLAKLVSSTAPIPGEVVTFTLTVTNAGPDDATGVAVQDIVPVGFVVDALSISGGGVLTGSTIDWTGLTIVAGTSTNLTFDATVQTPTGAADEFKNTTQVTASDNFDPDSTPNNDDGDQSEDDEAAAAVVVQQSDLSLAKVISDPTPNVGDTVTFTLTLTNDGPDAATNVSIADIVPAGYSAVTAISSGGTFDGIDTVTWTVLAVPAFGFVQLTFDAIVDAPTGAVDEYENVAQVTAADQWDPDSTPDNDDGDQSEDDEAAAVAVPQVSDLSLVKTVASTTPAVGDVVTFTLTVTNDGPDAATNVSVRDVLPAGLAYVAGTIGGGTTQDDSLAPTLTWTIATLASGASNALVYDAQVVAVPDGVGGLDPTAYLNAAEITAADQFDPDSNPATGIGVDDGGDAIADDDESQLQLVPTIADLSLVKTTAATPQVGEVVTVTLTVTNDGPDEATAIEVTDTVPAGLVYQSGSIAGGTTQNDTGAPVLVWTVDSLLSGASIVLTYDVLVGPPTGAAGEYTNQAEITAAGQWDPDSDAATGFGVDDLGDGVADDDEAEFTVDPQVADLSLVKFPPVTAPNVGDTVTYTLELTNDGPDAATNVEVTDTVPAGLVYQTGSMTGGDVQDETGAPALVWTIASIPALATVTLTYQVVVGPPTGDPLEYTNVAEVTGSDQFDPDSTPANGDATEDDYATSTIAPLQADLSFVKSTADTTPDLFDVVTFTLTVTNDGPDDATNVAVQDVLPAGLAYQAGSIGGGTTQDDSLAPTLTWTIASLASGASVDLTYDAQVVPVVDGTGNDVDPAAYLNAAEITASDQFDPDSDPATGFDVDEDGDGNPDDDDESRLALDPNVADVSVVKTAPVANPNVGDVVTLSLVVSNLGPDAATAVVVTDVLPAGMVYQVGSISGGDTQDDSIAPTLSWSIVSLGAGDAVTLEYDVEIVAVPDGLGGLDPAAYVNAAELTGSATWDPDSDPAAGFGVDDYGDGETDDDESTFAFDPPVADVSIVKAVTDATPQIGDVVTFTVTVTNIGPDQATLLEIADVLPAGLVYQAGSIAGGDTQDDSVAPTLTWTIASLDPGVSVDLEYDVEIVAVPDGAGNVEPAAYVNAAEVTAAATWDPDSDPASGFDTDDLADGIGDDDEALVQVDPEVADLSLTKVASNPVPALGEVVTFTLTVSNDGPDTATGVEVSDLIPAGLVYQTGSITGGTTQDESAAPALVWTIATVAGGATVVLTYDVVIGVASDGAGGLDPAGYVNAAEVSGSATWDPDSDPAAGLATDDYGDGAADDDESTAVLLPAVVGTAKAVAGIINNGDGTYDVSYVITVENMGLVELTDLTVVDDIATQLAAINPTGFSAADGSLTASPAWDGATANILAGGQSLAVGESGTVLVAFTVTPGTDLGPHDNVATASGTGPTGTVVTDDSTTGTDPDVDGDDTDGSVDGDGVPDENVPTQVFFGEAPSIGAAKLLAGDPVDQFDGSFGLTFEVVVENTGDVTLSQVQVEDDLAAVFAGAESFEVVGVSSADLGVNPAFDGVSDIALLDGAGTLAVGERATVTIDVIVFTGGETGPFENQATASGTSPGAIAVTDLSQDGADVDPDGDGDPTNDNDPTPITFPVLAALTGIVWYDLGADGVSTGEMEIPDVRVVLVMPGPDGQLGTADDIEREDFTASPYFFGDLAAGTYDVYVDTTTLPDYLTQTYDLDRFLDHRTTVQVISGTRRFVDFGYIEEIDLSLTKTAPVTVAAGTAIEWTILVENVGAIPGRPNIVVTDVIPAPLEVLGVSSAGATCVTTGGAVECTRTTDLLPGESFSVLVATTTGSGGTVSNNAIVSGSGNQFEPDLTTNAMATQVVVEQVSLPRTGQELGGFAGAGLAMVLLGAALVALVRRRPRRSA